MSESKLRDMSINFSVQVINLVKDLKARHETVISNQIGRSGTSIGQIFMKQIMRKEREILFQNSKLR